MEGLFTGIHISIRLSGNDAGSLFSVWRMLFNTGSELILLVLTWDSLQLSPASDSKSRKSLWIPLGLTSLSFYWATLNHILCPDFDAYFCFIHTPMLVSLSLFLRNTPKSLFVYELLLVYYLFIPLSISILLSHHGRYRKQRNIPSLAYRK